MSTSSTASSGAIEAGIALNTLSLDHLGNTYRSRDCVALRFSCGRVRLANLLHLLPTAAYFLRMQFQPAENCWSVVCAVALASDFNPGSSPSGNMNTVVSMSCIR